MEEQSILLPRCLPLAGSDYFLLALDYQMRHAGLPGNTCRLVLSLSSLLRGAELGAALDATGLRSWLGGAMIRKRLPPFTPQWTVSDCRVGIPIVEHKITDVENPGRPPIHETMQRLLRPTEPPLVVFDLFQHASSRTTVVLSWHHSIMDAHGAELLLRLVQRAACGEAPLKNDILDEAVFSVAKSSGRWRGLTERGQFARRSLFAVDEVCRPPIASLVGPSQQQRVPSLNCHERVRFTEEETRHIDNECDRSSARFCRSLYFLAAGIRAMHTVLTARGTAGHGAYVVPLPLDMRKVCSGGPVFSNHVSFLFFRAEPSYVRSFSELAGSLTSQMMNLMRSDTPNSFATALELFRHFPLHVYAKIIRGPSKGQMASFYFSDVGHSCSGMETLLGCRILDIAHFAPVTVPPGLGIVSGRFKNRIYLIISWITGCLSDQELKILIKSLRHDLLTGGLE